MKKHKKKHVMPLCYSADRRPLLVGVHRTIAATLYKAQPLPVMVAERASGAERRRGATSVPRSCGCTRKSVPAPHTTGPLSPPTTCDAKRKQFMCVLSPAESIVMYEHSNGSYWLDVLNCRWWTFWASWLLCAPIRTAQSSTIIFAHHSASHRRAITAGDLQARRSKSLCFCILCA